MKIAVIGSGYVGLVTGTCFAQTGNTVKCVDIDLRKVQKMQEGIIPIYEPGLELLFKNNIAAGRLTFTTSLEHGIEDAEVIFLALPTPPGEDGSADLSYILNVSKQLGALLKNYVVIVDKSTVPVGTAEKVRAAIAPNANVKFDVVSNPEFLREGVAVDDFMKPDRVVVGTKSLEAQAVMKRLYEPFVDIEHPLIFMDERSAELTKYAGNAFLAMKISFMNEMANLSELLGTDIDFVRRGIGTDNRIGNRFLYSGIGYGGSCFPKDVQALAKMSEEANYDFQILKSVMNVNKSQKKILVDKLDQLFESNYHDKKIAIWGLAFKPDTDDIREAPALEIIASLLSRGAKVSVSDPEAIENVKNIFGDKIEYCTSPYDVLDNADALLILTEWNEYSTPDLGRIKTLLREPVILDGRNMYSLKEMETYGFHYESMGRPAVKAMVPEKVLLSISK
jgi:UDPglucose 6-dehydrogenase